MVLKGVRLLVPGPFEPVQFMEWFAEALHEFMDGGAVPVVLPAVAEHGRIRFGQVHETLAEIEERCMGYSKG